MVIFFSLYKNSHFFQDVVFLFFLNTLVLILLSHMIWRKFIFSQFSKKYQEYALAL